MKKGFTLIELLGIICLLSIVVLVSYNFITQALNKADLKIDEATKKLLISYTEDYINDNYDSYDKNNSTTKNCIKLKTLLDKNYIDSSFLKQTKLTENNYMVFYGNGSFFDIEVDINNVCES